MPPRDRPDAPRVDLPGRQLDALREVVNIASGHAATALSQLTDRRIMITVPEFAVATIDGIPRALGYGDAPVAAVAMHVLGDVTGSLVYLMPTDTARDLAAHLLQRAGSAPPGRDGTRFDALAESSLKETANIIGGAYANALAALLGGMVMLSVPSFGIAPPDHVLGEHRRRVHGDPFALCIETALEIEGAGTSCGGHLLLVADEGTIQSILAALKVT